MQTKKTLTVIASLFLFYCVVVAFISPLFIKSIIKEEAKNSIHGNVDLESLFINPLNNSITLKGISLKDEKGQLLASVEKIYVNINLVPLIILNGQVDSFEIDNLKLLSENNSWLHLPKLQINTITAAIMNQEVVIEEIILKSLALNPVLHADDASNVELFLTDIDKLLIAEPETTTDKTVEKEALEEEAEPWLVEIKDVKLINGVVSLRDKTISNELNPNGITTDIRPFNIHLISFKSDLSQDTKVNVNLDLLGGNISIQGFVNAGTQRSEFKYTVSNIQLTDLNNYIEDASYASIISGELNTFGTLTSQLLTLTTETKEETKNTDLSTSLDSEVTEDSKPTESIDDEISEEVLDLVLTNNLTLSNLAIKHQNFKGEFVRCDDIQSQDLSFSLLESSLNLNKFSVVKCVTAIILDKNSKGNFEFEKPSSKETKTQDESTLGNNSEASKPLNINLALVELLNHTVTIEDFTQGEKVSIRLGDLQAKIENIATGKRDLTKYSLKTTINEHAPFTINGDGNFLNPKMSANTMIDLNDLGLTPFSPYTLNLSSRQIEKGVLTIDVDVELIDNHLESKNHVSLKGLDLSKKQAHEGASKLPIALAVGILKDKDGVIEFDIPVTGDIDDPSFSITKQVIKVVTNLITKAATAPLSMIGGIVTGSDNTNEQVIVFEDGSDVLTEIALRRIKKIGGVLNSHPEFSINISTGLSAFEQETLTNDKAKTHLMTSRQEKVTQTLMSSEISAQQLVSVPIDISNTKENASVEVEFFAR